MVSDAGLRDVVAAAGYHYSPDDDSAGNFKRLAMDYDKEIWNSEAQATFGNSAFRPIAVGVDEHQLVDDAAAVLGVGEQGSMQERHPESTAPENDEPHAAHIACHIQPWPWLHRLERR